MSDEKRDTSGDRYVAVALMKTEGHAHTGVLDREANKVAEHLMRTHAHALNDGEYSKNDFRWTLTDRVVILGELGPVPERIKPPFEVERFNKGKSALNRRVTIQRVATTGDACLTAIQGHHLIITPEDAPAIASAILRAAGLDVESVVLPKGGE